jgi:hypothetical protein
MNWCVRVDVYVVHRKASGESNKINNIHNYKQLSKNIIVLIHLIIITLK